MELVLNSKIDTNVKDTWKNAGLVKWMTRAVMKIVMMGLMLVNRKSMNGPNGPNGDENNQNGHQEDQRGHQDC